MRDDCTPYYSTEYLIRKSLKMTEDEIQANQKWIDAEKNMAEEQELPEAPEF